MPRPSVLLASLALLGLAPPAASMLDADYLITMLTRIAIYAMAASALNLVLGFGRMVSFGHAAFLGVGGYVVAILSLHAYEALPLFGLPASNHALIAWPAAALAGGAAAFLIGAISLRTKGAYFIMITLAFAQMVYFFFLSLQPYGGEDGISIWWGRNLLAPLDLEDDLVFFYTVFALLSGWLILARRLMESPFGQVLQATRQNEIRLQALGVEPYRYKLAAFALSGAACGLAGALLVNLNTFASPAMLHWSRSGELMVMCIMGGLGTTAGPVLGAAGLILLEESLLPHTEHWQLFLGIALLAVVLTTRRGLMDLLGGRGGMT